MAISAHKFGGPKGTGALVVRGGVPLEPLIEGGGQERGLRSGTSNVAGAVAMAAALAATRRDARSTARGSRALRDRLVDGLLASGPRRVRERRPRPKVAGNAHLGFHGVEAETLLVLLDQAGVCAAAGSSCSSGATEPSHVLDAMGIARDDGAVVDPAQPRLRVDRADVDVALAGSSPTAVARAARAAGVRRA